MKALILNGALKGDEGLAPVEQAVRSVLSQHGWDAEGISLRDLTIAYCQGCFECWIKTPGLCKISDSAAGVTAAIIRSDLLVLLSPVTFGGYSSELKKALDRSICLVSPFFMGIDGEVHHRRRYERYPRLLGLGVLPNADAEQERVFAQLLRRNAINLHSPWQTGGVIYRTQPPDQMRAMVAQLVARVLARLTEAA